MPGLGGKLGPLRVVALDVLEHELLRLADKLDRCGAPFILIHDQGHVEPPDFDGSLTLTALGAGPFPRGEEPGPLRRLPLWSGGRWIMT